MAKFWTWFSICKIPGNYCLNPVTGWPSFGRCAWGSSSGADRLNPVTGWPSFGRSERKEYKGNLQVLILLLDGQVLDYFPSEVRGFFLTS